MSSKNQSEEALTTFNGRQGTVVNGIELYDGNYPRRRGLMSRYFETVKEMAREARASMLDAGISDVVVTFEPRLARWFVVQGSLNTAKIAVYGAIMVPGTTGQDKSTGLTQDAPLSIVPIVRQKIADIPEDFFLDLE